MYKKQELLSIREWSLRYGIKTIKPNGFKGKSNQILSRLYSKRQFINGIKRSYITVNTEKGLEFIERLNKNFLRAM